VMQNVPQHIVPRYVKIAVDISTRIVAGEIQEGEKLKGRSILATEYNVSPETIRRSMSILSDKKVVKILLGSGIIVLSKEMASQFILNFQDEESISEIRWKLNNLFQKRESMDQEIVTLTNQMIDMYKYRRLNVVIPVEVMLPNNSNVIGKSIGELGIWQNTGVTIIGIIQNGQVIISPGPYYTFSKGDKILIVGDETAIDCFRTFIHEFHKTAPAVHTDDKGHD